MWNQGGYGESKPGFDQGGGFMNSPGFGASQKTRDTGKKAQYIVPCTIAQVLDAVYQDDKFFIDGKHEIPQVTLVGMIRDVKESGSRVEYMLDDFSGPPVEVRIFIDNDPESDEEPPEIYKVNTYVRIYGSLRVFQDKRNVVAFKVQPLLDMNELTYHILQVIRTSLHYAKQGAGDAPPAAVYGGETGAGYSGGAYGGGGYGGGGYGGGGYGGGADQGINPTQNKILDIIRNCMNEEGISIQDVSKRMGGTGERQIREAVEFLSTEGHIYSTIDDDHFRSTDSM